MKQIFNSDGVEIITREEWVRAHRRGDAHIWDGRRWIKRLVQGDLVYRIVEVR